MRLFGHMTKMAVVAGTVLAGLGAAAGPANAASSPIEACGGGSYHEIDHHDINGARIYLLYDGGTDCVVTWKTSNIGKKTFVSAGISLTQFKDGHIDQGQYIEYAGPVKLYAPGKCIIWGGDAGPGDSGTDLFASQPDHCG